MTVDFSRDVHCLLGLPFDRVSLAEAVSRLRAAAKTRRRCFLSTPNLNFAVGCRDDAAFRHTVIDSDLSIADGMPLVWAARLLGVPIRERVAGSDVFAVLRASREERLGVYIFGGADGAAEAACRRLNAEGGGLHCVGFASPGFGSVEAMSDEATIAHINASGADFLVVALGARKGQAWIEHNRARLTVPVISHLGAVVNFTAGTVGRAPRWMQRSGLEWCWRIVEEPVLWRRYLNDGLIFTRLLLVQVLPGLVHRYCSRPAASELERTALRRISVDGISRVTLAGAWTEANLDALRSEFAALAATRDSVIIDLADVSYVDSAFVGTLLLAAGELRRRNCRLSIVSARSAVRLSFHCLGAGYMLGRR